MPKAPVRDIVMYYEEAGTGDPLILLMGLGGDLQGWALTVPELAKHYRVITLDNRGAGRTSAPDRPYTVSGMADDVAALMDHLGIAKAHVLGFSMGGMVAQELALRHPGRVDRLILVATAPSVEPYVHNVIRSLADARRSNMSREQVSRLTANLLYTAEFMADTARFERAIANGLANPYAQQDHAWLRQAQACLAFDAADRIKGIKAKTLVLAGEDDILIPARNGERIAAAVPGATLRRLPGGHAGCIERAPDYNAAVLEFLGAD